MGRPVSSDVLTLRSVVGCTASFCVWPSFKRLQHCEYKSSRHGIENNRTCRDNRAILEQCIQESCMATWSKERHSYLNSKSGICGLASIWFGFWLVWSYVKVTRPSQRKRLVGREALGPGQLEVKEVGGQVQVRVPPLKLQIITGLAEKVKRKWQWVYGSSEGPRVVYDWLTCPWRNRRITAHCVWLQSCFFWALPPRRLPSIFSVFGAWRLIPTVLRHRPPWVTPQGATRTHVSVLKTGQSSRALTQKQQNEALKSVHVTRNWVCE